MSNKKLTKEICLAILEEFAQCILNTIENEYNTDKISDDMTDFVRINKDYFNDIDSVMLKGNSFDVIEIMVNKKCIDQIRTDIIYEINPLQYFSMQGLDKYKKVLSGYIEEQQAVNMPKTFNDIIDLVSIHYANFSNSTLYNRHLMDSYKDNVFNINELSNQINDISERVRSVSEDITSAKDSIESDKTEIAANKEVINKTKKDLDEATINLRKLKRKLEGSLVKAVEMVITILGIFASIILTYHGVLSFSSSILNSLNSANTYKIVLLTLLVGLVGISLTFGLLFYLNTLRDRKKSKHMFCTFIVSVIVILLLIGMTIIAWNNGVIEKRNEAFEKKALLMTEEAENTEDINLNCVEVIVQE